MTPLDKASVEDRFGGKAAGLARALAAGLPVPPGFALAWDDAARVAVGDGPACAAVAAAARELASHQGGLLAVRSSAIGEDSAGASFAGQHRTCLGVVPAGVVAAVTAVHASAFTESALAYRQRLGISAEVRMAVVIQQLVAPDAAGVLFTRHPTTGADERVIEAAYGLGEAVVTGLVTPDSYRVARGGRVLESRIGIKDLALRALPGGGTEAVDIDTARADKPALTLAQVRLLEALASSCETLFAGPRDLEWALAGGDIFLLQCRSVTR